MEEVRCGVAEAEDLRSFLGVLVLPPNFQLIVSVFGWDSAENHTPRLNRNKGRECVLSLKAAMLDKTMGDLLQPQQFF